MSAPRVDLYTVIHKMLRAELFGATLHTAFSTFLPEYLSHMAVEEGAVNQCLWDHQSDD